MAKNSVRDFDATAANNTDIQSVNIAEGCAPSGINNAIRELMADMKDVSAGTIALESPQADSLTVTGDLTVDTNTLFVDASADGAAFGTTEISDATLSILGKASGGVNGHCIQIGGDSGVGNQGGVISFRQKGDSSQRATSWVGFAGFDNGSTRQLYYGGGGWGIENATIHAFYTNPSYDAGISASLERMRILSDGTVLIAQSANDSGVAGHIFNTNGSAFHVRDGGLPFVLNRLSDDGAIAAFRHDGSTDGQINVKSGDILIGTGSCALRFGSTGYLPSNVTTNGLADNTLDIGSGAYRYDDIFATNTTIQTSDQNEKQQIAGLTDAEITAAKAISKLFKTFKWNDSVEAKGDNARTHTGHVAQEVQSAMTDAGLDVTKYAFWCSDTWWEHLVDVPAVKAIEAVYEDVVTSNEFETERTEKRLVSEAVEAQDAHTRVDAYYTAEEAPEGATERTRLGIRYPQLLAFVGAATEQRLTSIEARLTALEG